MGRIFGVYKGTLYNWMKRYESGGLDGLASMECDRMRAAINER